MRHQTLAASAVCLISIVPTMPVKGQSMGEFPPGSFAELEELPAGRFRNDLGNLPPQAQQRAKAWLRDMHFTSQDLHSMHADANGGVCFACNFHAPPIAEVTEDDVSTEADVSGPSAAAVPVSPFPETLKFSSLPGATNVIYLNFSGMVVTGTEWNTTLGRTSIPTVAFSTDSDLTTFSDAEQLAIKRIWQRMAEDFAPFNVNVTTAPPATITTRTAVALITRNTDANGQANPFNTAGGVAYVNVFGRTDFVTRYSPAFVYHNNLSNNESFIAEAASHEIGHNLGLTHDGLTTGADYYGGHGSGDISWATIMGTGYNRNVSQWSKGEYTNANNTQDDLSIIAGKLGYKTDDHGGTSTSATPLAITNGNQIVSTTFENDPSNSNKANKGILERNTDIDVFSFSNGNGPVTITASPWLMAAGTRGGNLDILLEIRDAAGTLVAGSNPADKTGATISAMLAEGQYFLHVRNTGTGSPLASTPTGYTDYGSIGTYYLSGSITDASGFNPAPLAQLATSDITAIGTATHTFTVTYSDNFAVDIASIGTGDVRVTGPNGYDKTATFISVDNATNGTPRTATYSIPPPAGATWDASHNGIYQISLQADQVSDTQGAFVAAGALGGFEVALPVPVYLANMTSNPGWTLDPGPAQNSPGWQYGIPAYPTSATGPKTAFTGTHIVAYNLSGNYTKGLTTRYATTPAIPLNGATNLTLQFRRWLRLTNQGIGTIEFSTNGTTWTTLWSGSSVADTSWQLVQYALPASVHGSTSIRLRWGISSGNRPLTDVGWNLDDVMILGNGVIDTTPPTAALSVGNLTQGGAPSHSCAVTYTDGTAVRLSSLGNFNLAITGPNGYSTYTVTTEGVETSTLGFAGADRSSDGSPITGSYDIPAPGGSWGAEDNGTYTITLRVGTVEDTLNNTVVQAVLGSFQVAVTEAAPGQLTVAPESGFSSTGVAGGTFTPRSTTYTLSNSGGSSLDWTAEKSATWLDLSATSGSLAPGTATEVLVSLNDQAASLPAGDYDATLQFSIANSSMGLASRQVVLTVSPGGEVTRFTQYGRNESGVFVFTITGIPGSAVEIQWSEDMKQWNTLLNTVIGEDGTLAVEDPASADKPHRFYRVGTPP